MTRSDLNVRSPVSRVEAPVTSPVFVLAVGVADKLLGREIGLALRTLCGKMLLVMVRDGRDCPTYTLGITGAVGLGV